MKHKIATNTVEISALTVYNPVQLKIKFVLNRQNEDTSQKYVDQQSM